MNIVIKKTLLLAIGLFLLPGTSVQAFRLPWMGETTVSDDILALGRLEHPLPFRREARGPEETPTARAARERPLRAGNGHMLLKANSEEVIPWDEECLIQQGLYDFSDPRRDTFNSHSPPAEQIAYHAEQTREARPLEHRVRETQKRRLNGGMSLGELDEEEYNPSIVHRYNIEEHQRREKAQAQERIRAQREISVQAAPVSYWAIVRKRLNEFCFGRRTAESSNPCQPNDVVAQHIEQVRTPDLSPSSRRHCQDVVVAPTPHPSPGFAFRTARNPESQENTPRKKVYVSAHQASGNATKEFFCLLNDHSVGGDYPKKEVTDSLRKIWSKDRDARMRWHATLKGEQVDDDMEGSTVVMPGGCASITREAVAVSCGALHAARFMVYKQVNERLREMIDSGELELNATDEFGTPLLKVAVDKDFPLIAQHLMNRGVDAAQPDAAGNTVLMGLLKKKDPDSELLGDLLKRKPPVMQPNVAGDTAVSILLKRKDNIFVGPMAHLIAEELQETVGRAFIVDQKIVQAALEWLDHGTKVGLTKDHLPEHRKAFLKALLFLAVQVGELRDPKMRDPEQTGDCEPDARLIGQLLAYKTAYDHSDYCFAMKQAMLCNKPQIVDALIHKALEANDNTSSDWSLVIKYVDIMKEQNSFLEPQKLNYSARMAYHRAINTILNLLPMGSYKQYAHFMHSYLDDNNITFLELPALEKAFFMIDGDIQNGTDEKAQNALNRIINEVESRGFPSKAASFRCMRDSGSSGTGDSFYGGRFEGAGPAPSTSEDQPPGPSEVTLQ